LLKSDTPLFINISEFLNIEIKEIVQISSSDEIVKIPSIIKSFCLILANENLLIGWYYNSDGQLGDFF
jgi:hypothetical protein